MKNYRTVYRTIPLSALVAMLFGGTASPAFAAGLTPLGDLPGGIFDSIAKDVSADGSVVVGVSSSASGNEAFRWTAASGMVGLGGLQYEGTGESNAFGVSGDGSTVVGFGASAVGPEAFRWTAASGMGNMGNFPGGAVATHASAANGDGSVVVGAGFRWTEASGLVGLDDLPGGLVGSSAEDVSSDGSTIVGDSHSGNGSEAFRWTAASGMVGLGDLLGGGFGSFAHGVSADGSVAVGQSRSTFGDEAFRWTQGGGMIGLGDLPGGNFESLAWDVSADGSTVVGEGNSDTGRKAVRWTSGGGMVPLWDVLLANGIDPAADGWTQLIRAWGVSADGNTIVGFGVRNDYLEAFVAVVPEPASLALLALGLPFLVGRNLRRSRTGCTRGVHRPMTVLSKL